MFPCTAWLLMTACSAAPYNSPISKLPKPEWLKTRFVSSDAYREMTQTVQNLNLHTVCQEAACPNINECWSQGHATVMILGRVCTRACRFCHVDTGKPDPVDAQEPLRVSQLVAHLKLSHVVITSVDRDDLEDGGAEHFSETIQAVRALNPHTTIEVLTPDFLGKEGALEKVMAAKPDVFNHNVETVPRLYTRVRSKARYFHSLYLLKRAKYINPEVFTKSGLMLGLGEDDGEVRQVMNDLRAADVDFLTIGQYLQPTEKHHPVHRYVHPDEYHKIKATALKKGFLYVAASPWTRSSYHAGSDFLQLQKRRLQTA